MVPNAIRMIYNRGMLSKRHSRLLIGVLAAVSIIPIVASAELRISEIMYDPDGADGKNEWIEIFNEGPYLVDLSVAKFVDKSGHVLNLPPKNGGTGTMTIVPGAYVILASDATAFHAQYPNVNQVIDTAMSLSNSGARIGIGSSKGPLAIATYDSSMGGNGTGESLQLHEGTWIHAQPTPGRENAHASTVAAAPVSPAPVAKKAPAVAKSSAKPKKQRGAVSKSVAETASADPVSIVNATATERVIAETAAAGSLGGTPWWFAAAALALSTGAAASMISRSKKQEWNIEES